MSFIESNVLSLKLAPFSLAPHRAHNIQAADLCHELGSQLSALL